MNAKEAKLTAQKRAEEIKKKHEAAERKSAEEHARKWREERANWFKNEIESITASIAEAVDKGKTDIEVWMNTSDEPEQAEEKAFRARFAYEPELKQVLKHFEDEDYKLKFAVKEKRNVDLSDLNPRDDWYTYETTLEISW
jgi:hypothetical protein